MLKMTASIHQLAPAAARVEPANYTTAEVAKLIRRALREAFPEIKFSVRIHTYSMGCSTRVRWSDGPLKADVERIVAKFQSKDFDGMDDSTHYRRHTIDGKPVSLHTGYLFCDRDLDDAKVARLAAILEPLSNDEREQIAYRYGVQRWFHPLTTAAETARTLLSTCSPIDYSDRVSAFAETVSCTGEW